MAEYWYRRYDYTNHGSQTTQRLNTQGRIDAISLKDAKEQTEKRNGCASVPCIWSNSSTPTRHWSFGHVYGTNRGLQVELFPSEDVMLKTPINGENWLPQ